MRGGDLAKGQTKRGATAVFRSAGATGLGVLQAMAEAGRLGGGADSNQTSTEKSFAAPADGACNPAVTVPGLAQGGVALAMDAGNAAVAAEAEEARMAQATAGIIAGGVRVHGYMVDKSRPEWPAGCDCDGGPAR